MTPPGIHLLHKPVGPTSFSVVEAARTGARTKTCHGGALDPFASGLLLILVEPATKLFDHLHAIPKFYEATVRWGVETDNGDPLGKVVSEGDATNLSPGQLDDALKHFIGWHDQTPPATSNKRIDGERAYAKAHRGETFELPPSRVYLHEAQWIAHDLPRESRIRMVVRGGYYVRALARDLGRSLGCGAHLTALHRTAIGPWNDPGPGQQVELHGREIMPWAPTRILTDQEVGELRGDRPIAAGELLAPDWSPPPGWPDPQAPVRGFHRDRFAFLLQREEERLRVLTALPGNM
ncbi:MAG: tRNA pseudouridine55 synthase [Humisphaera sp.]|nr:tRNA pseudouridine55 synthase [Humisphaera sp.]